MAIVLDAVASSHAGASSLTFAHVVGAISNSLLVVSISSQDSNHANVPITGVTYNGVALTKAKEDMASSNNTSSSIWYLLNPASGTHNVIVSATGSVQILAVSSSWSGVAQSGQPDASAGAGTANNNSSSPSQAITTVADNSLIVDAISSEANRTAIGGSQTTIGVVQGQSFENVSASYMIKTPAGSATMSATLSSGQPWSMTVASFSPVAAAGATRTPRLALLGVG